MQVETIKQLALLPNSPIGIFDSGLGGLTVAKKLSLLLPGEDIIYFGDTNNAPWGDKSPSFIKEVALQICEKLMSHHCKCLVIACNTATTAAHEAIEAAFGEDLLVINVIDPVIERFKVGYTGKRVGLIGTRQTIRSNSYKRKLDGLNRGIKLCALATPSIVPLMEQGLSERPLMKMMIHDYLSHKTLQGIEAIILGCTHYPFIKHHIEDYYQGAVEIIDSIESTVRMIHRQLIERGLLHPRQQTAGERLFYLSKASEVFETKATSLFHEAPMIRICSPDAPGFLAKIACS